MDDKEINYNVKVVFDTIQKYYPIEVKIVIDNITHKFFKKENSNEFLGAYILINSEKELNIYFFKSSYFSDDNLYEDFKKYDIKFRVENLQTLDIILNANSLVS